MSDLYYKNLYKIQDEVLEIVGSISSPFYLTGGTAISRFLLNHRFSDDLDFFPNRNARFHEEVDKLIERLKDKFSSVETNNRQDSYVKVYITVDPSLILKLEFVNNVGYRVGEPGIHQNGFLIDNWQNILSNKLTALQREAGKDYVDSLFICLNFSFNWEEIINHAKQKDAWINEINISKFFSNLNFDKLKEVKFPASFQTESISQEFFNIMARESLHGFDNSLYGKKL
jgi:hypothetical protein